MKEYIEDKYYPYIDRKKNITTKELQNEILDIILEVDRVCRKNNVPYALAFGSALGIFNYAGFIPWDDDADIAIDYDDLDKFIKALEKDLNKDKFYFQCYENDKDYNVLIPTMKIRKKNTYIKEENWLFLPNRCISGDGLFIDVVAVMGVPENKKEHRLLLNFSKKRMLPYIIQDVFFHKNPLKIKKELKEFEKYVALKYKKSSVVGQTVIIPFQDLGENKTISYPKEIIFPFREYEFEGHKLYSFNNIEKYIELNYGQESKKILTKNGYIDPYPIKKRKTKHTKKIKF